MFSLSVENSSGIEMPLNAEEKSEAYSSFHKNVTEFKSLNLLPIPLNCEQAATSCNKQGKRREMKPLTTVVQTRDAVYTVGHQSNRHRHFFITRQEVLPALIVSFVV